MSASEHHTHFKTLHKLQADYSKVTITQYESQRTGMRVFVADQPGPKVSGWFSVPTEIFDDSGAPHTLEHTTFAGSKAYPHRGMLDRLGQRSYVRCSGLTHIDHTTYSLNGAGWAGVAQILPVYLDHLLRPTLTDEACYLEVHHVDGKGDDQGVVYSENQGRQNTMGALMSLRAKRLFYPEGSGYRSHTGGLLEEVRELTPDRIRAFHKAMYKPQNLCLVLAGEVNHDELLKILDAFEDTIIDEVPAFDAPFKRPWVDSKRVDPIAETIIETVEFPAEDESTGSITISFFGPRYDEFNARIAVGVLNMYLCDTSIGVLDRKMVEEEKLCSSVSQGWGTGLDNAIDFDLEGVETEKLAEVEARVHSILQETGATELDMDHLRDCISRWKRAAKMDSEDDALYFTSALIDDHLSGNRDGRDLRAHLVLEELDILEPWTDRQWRDFLSKWLLDAHHISVLGKPSRALAMKQDEEEKARVEARKERLGPAGLEELAKKLKESQDKVNTPIPDSMWAKFPVPDVNSVHFLSTTTARAGRARSVGALDNDMQRLIDRDNDNSPLLLHFENIPSRFVTVGIDMSTGSVPVHLKPLVCLYLMNFFATPVMRQGKRMEFREVVVALQKVTPQYSIDFNGVNGEMVSISMFTEVGKYDEVISWMRTLLFDAIHEAERLQVQLHKILADIPDEKRSGSGMMWDVCTMLSFKRNSLGRAGCTLSQAPFMKTFQKLLKTDPIAGITLFSQLCKTLHRPENFRIFVATDINKLQRPVSAWNEFTSGLDESKPLEPLGQSTESLAETGRNPGDTCVIVPMLDVKSSWTVLMGKCCDSYDDPDLPALMVAVEYMIAVEGPFWNAVRGDGLAYGTSLTNSTGLARECFYFSIIRAPDAFKALQASKALVEGYASGERQITSHGVEGAVSTIVRHMANKQSSMAATAGHSYTNQVVREVSKDWSHQMLSKVQSVTKDEVCAVMKKYLRPVFEPETSNMYVTCARDMTGKLVADLTEAGYQPQVRALESFEDGYVMEGPAGADDEGPA